MYRFYAIINESWHYSPRVIYVSWGIPIWKREKEREREREKQKEMRKKIDMVLFLSYRRLHLDCKINKLVLSRYKFGHKFADLSNGFDMTNSKAGHLLNRTFELHDKLKS